jgi:hypothetical protein
MSETKVERTPSNAEETRSARSLLHALLPAVAIVVLLGSGTAAQERGRLPAELGRSSSVYEILSWLDRTSFPYARVGLKTGGSEGSPDSYNPDWQEGTPSYTLVFSQGFRLSGIGGCTPTLKNGDTYLVDHSKLVSDTGSHRAAELELRLDEMSPTKGKGPYLHTKNPEKAGLVGAWRTEYRYKNFWRRRVVAELTLFSKESQERLVAWDGVTLTFTFDSKEMSEKFDAALRQAIRLCNEK